MLDRESTFADPEIVQLLKTSFVPVAIDQAYQRRQQDSEGEFYRRIAGQGPRKNFEYTTQGFYIAAADGTLLLFNNNRDPAKLRRLMQEKLKQFAKSTAAQAPVAVLDKGAVDSRYQPSLPEGGLVVRTRAKVLGGYPPTTNRWRSIFQNAISRDNLWITGEEHQALVKGQIPASLQQRIARFHLVDNTRGEPPMWKPRELMEVKMNLEDGKLQGHVRLATPDNRRGYDAKLYGYIETQEGRVTRLDMVADGMFWGAGRYTGNPPPGKFPLAVSFSLADQSDVADAIPPQGSRGWLTGYLEN